MIHPHTKLKFISKEIGYGVIATKLIPKGSITWCQDYLDQSFSPSDVNKMDTVYKDILDKYSYRDNEGNFVLCWDNARFINHSFHSNCITTAYDFELAIRDINPGEELTDDYGYLNCVEPFKCKAEPDTDRKWVMPDDLLHFYRHWDSKLLSSFAHLTQLEQPLWPLIKSKYQKKIKAILDGAEQMDSILNSFYSNDKSLMEKKKELLSQYTLRSEGLLLKTG